MTELDRFRTALEGLAESHLSAYLKRIQDSRPPRTPKEFNDPIWQTVVLHPIEVVVLDSPLLQRLRRIRQLGVAHLVYPGAVHTRFEHSIGVVHQVQRLITAINSRAGEGSVVDDSMTNLLRLAALCHDVGHGAMSHVSENALRSCDIGEDLRLMFADAVGIERASLAEIASYHLVGSGPFRTLLDVAQRTTGQRLPPEPAVAIQKMILGQPVSQTIPLLHEFISGPFDADKLDYMPRDATMSGVPVVTDIPRLIQKVRSIKVRQEDLPPEVARSVEQGHPFYVLTGIALSGGRTLDELMLGRTLLFDKIYRHQKGRAAEAMVASVFSLIADVIAEPPSMAPYVLTDEDVLSLDEEGIARLAVRPLGAPEKARVRTAADLLARLRTRRLFVRCVAFAQRMPLDPYREDVEQRVGLERILRESRNVAGRKALIQRIATETFEIVKALGEAARVANLGDDLRPYLWIDPTEPHLEDTEIGRAYLLAEDGKVLRFRDEAAQTRGWADAYLMARETGYIFSADEIAPFAFLAAEVVLRADYGVRIPPSMLSYAKQDAGALDGYKQKLAKVGYYKGRSLDLLPLPGRLRKADVRGRCGAVVARLGGYHGPTTPASAGAAAAVSGAKIVNWVRQFGDDDRIVEAALDMVGAVKLIGREDVCSTVQRFIENHPAFAAASICPLGSPKDSSGVTTYYVQDLASKYSIAVCTLDEALRRSAPILFVDDFIGSGRQAVTIVEELLSMKPSFELGEERCVALDEKNCRALREREVGFVFAAGWKEGRDLLDGGCRKVGLKACVEVGEHDLPMAFGTGVIKDQRGEEALRNLCASHGKTLLLGGHDAKWAEERALGYGNRAQLVVFPYNTPSQTLTCLWAAGDVGGALWSPLFPRRKKT